MFGSGPCRPPTTDHHTPNSSYVRRSKCTRGTRSFEVALAFRSIFTGILLLRESNVKRSLLQQWLQDRREERRLEKQIEEIGAKFRPRMAAAKTEQEEHDID